MRSLIPLAAVLIFVSVSCGHRACAQGQPQPGQPLQGGVQQDENVPSTAQIQADETNCRNSGLGIGTSEPCIALSLQVRGINKDAGCLSLIIAGVTLVVEQMTLSKKFALGGDNGPSGVALNQQILQLTTQITQNANAISARGCLNPSSETLLKGYINNTPDGDSPPSNSNPESRGGLPLPPNVQQALRATAAKMDQIADNAQNYALAGTDHFFKCMAEALSADAKFLAQPGYVPAAQVAQALHDGTWNYLTGDAYNNNLQMYQAAQQSLNNLKQDPACAIAKIVPAATAAAVTHLAGAAAEANAVQSAANNAMELSAANAERETAWQSGPAKYGQNPINQFNPSCAPNMCFPAADAQDITWETGEPVSAQPFAGNVTVQIVKGTPTKVFNLTSSKTVQALLHDFYGSKKLQGPMFDSTRTVNQIDGIPTAMPEARIQSDLLAAGPGARGYVFAQYPPDKNGIIAGHVLNVRNVNGSLQAVDASNSGMNASSFFQGATQTWFYRTQ